MAASAEVSIEGAVLEMESFAAVIELSSPKNTIPTSEKNIESFDNSNSKETRETDVTDGVEDSGLNSIEDSKLELQMKKIVDMLKKLELNPLAMEFFPSSYYQSQNVAYNFVPIKKNLENNGFSHHRREFDPH